jgi:hypothetical protein
MFNIFALARETGKIGRKKAICISNIMTIARGFLPLPSIDVILIYANVRNEKYIFD